MTNANFKCPNCWKPVYKKPSQKNAFCDRGCYDRYYNIAGTSVIACVFCDKTFKARSTTTKFCSRKCSNQARTGIKYNRSRPECNIQRSYTQRNALIERDGHRCLFCNVGPSWNGKDLKLQIDHIDGNRKNNVLDNLRLLCPNCHSQTETWGKRKTQA